MGGHGGLNILPQKRWNVYNFENREKVRKDEEAAAREEQLKREDSLRRDAEFRLERLRHARGIAAPAAGDAPGSGDIPPADSRHINLFEDLQDFSSLTGSGRSEAGREEERGNGKEKRKRDEGSSRDQKRKREERPAAIAPEDEKYRMGYGVAGKGVKAPWYLSRPSLAEAAEESSDGRESGRGGGHDSKKSVGGKKTIEELRAERLEREKREKERERAVLKSSKKRYVMPRNGSG